MSHGAVDVWETLRATALIGTGRQSPDFGSAANGDSENPLTVALAALDKTAPEASLLDAAALVSLYQLAGQVPDLSTDALPAPCPAETKPFCSARAVRFLEQVLAERGDTAALTHEWLRTAATRGEIAPPHTLLGLLPIGRQNVAIRPQLVAVIGERGRWLAAQNSDWKYVFGQTGDLFAQDGAAAGGVDWETAETPARIAHLADLRKSDPTRARELVAAVWKQEIVATRRSFLQTFAVGLSLDDEAFLESALDDRGKEVRALACDFLANLPDSQFAGRMTARAAVCVLQVERTGILGLGGMKMTVEPPTEADYKASQKAMTRDGITAKSEMHNVGDRAWWLQQIVRYTPLSHWDTSRYSPDDHIAAAQKTDWHPQLINGWMQAAHRERNETWQAALWIYLLEHYPNWSHYDVLDASRLSGALHEELVLKAIRGSGRSQQWSNVGGVLLQGVAYGEALRTPSPAFVRAALLEVKGTLSASAGRRNIQSQTLYSLMSLAPAIPIEMVAEVVAELDGIELGDEYAKQQLEEFRRTLTTRRDLHKGFEQE